MKSFSKAAILVVVSLMGTFACASCAVAQATNNPAPQERALAQSQPSRQRLEAGEVFLFPGGSPGAFVNAVQTQYKVVWTDIVTIPNEMTNAQVPKLRVPTEQPDDLLRLYNRLGERNPNLGQWHWEGPVDRPHFLALVPGKGKESTSPAEEPLALRVFQLRYISGTNLNTFADAITTAADVPDASEHRTGRNPSSNRLVIDSRTGSVVASGTAAYLTRVQAVVRALDVPTVEPGEVLRNRDGSSGPSTPAGQKKN